MRNPTDSHPLPRTSAVTPPRVAEALVRPQTDARRHLATKHDARRMQGQSQLSTQGGVGASTSLSRRLLLAAAVG